MIGDDPDWYLFGENLNEPPMSLEERAERIASVIESGKASTIFLKELSETIRPNGKVSDYRFVLRRTRSGRQAGGKDGARWRLGYEMTRLVDDEELTIDEAVYRVQSEFGIRGNSRSNCLAALKEAREAIGHWEAFKALGVRKSED